MVLKNSSCKKPPKLDLAIQPNTSGLAVMIATLNTPIFFRRLNLFVKLNIFAQSFIALAPPRAVKM